MRKAIAISMTLMLVATVVLAQQPDAKKQPGKKNAPQAPSQPPTYPDVKYGPYARNVMDVWLAKSDKPTPVLVSIHGGGFSGGNKSVGASTRCDECLKSGISVVAITYRLSDEAKAPAQFLDSARAIQFIRSKAKEWNIDPTRIAATGGSAGAGISLWLGFHDDLADPKNARPRTAAVHSADLHGRHQRPDFLRSQVHSGTGAWDRHLQGRGVGASSSTWTRTTWTTCRRKNTSCSRNARPSTT